MWGKNFFNKVKTTIGNFKDNVASTIGQKLLPLVQKHGLYMARNLVRKLQPRVVKAINQIPLIGKQISPFAQDVMTGFVENKDLGDIAKTSAKRWANQVSGGMLGGLGIVDLPNYQNKPKLTPDETLKGLQNALESMTFDYMK